ncbi:MAG: hypothetical protein RugAbin2_01412 [Rugosibacter sp.]|jgi:hypothetical protein|nr:hypothetical protein [Rugosibacter sp.]
MPIRTMRYALDMDFVRRRRLASPLGLLLFAVGMMATGAVAVDYLDAGEELHRVKVQQARLLRQVPHDDTSPRGRKSASTVVRDDVQAAERVVSQLNLPWNALLRELENLADPAVALISIEGQGQARTLRMTGEAKTMADVAAYVTRLRGSSQIDAATLSGHEKRQVGAVEVIRFSLDVDWGGRP